MSAMSRPRFFRSEFRAWRARLRRRGFRSAPPKASEPNSPQFAAEAHRQSALAAHSPHAEEDQAFVDSISDALPD